MSISTRGKEIREWPSLILEVQKEYFASDPPSESASGGSLSEELLTVTELFRAGALTDQEFKDAKARILG